MGTAASEPRCRCVYLHHGGDQLLDPTAYKGVATMRPLEAGSASCHVPGSSGAAAERDHRSIRTPTGPSLPPCPGPSRSGLEMPTRG
jgi:hypothetical protein